VDNALNETGYTVERATASAGPFAVVTTLAANTIAYSNTSLASGTTYYYRVKATNSAGSSPYSDVANATALASAASMSLVEETKLVNNLTVNPNRMRDRTLMSFVVVEEQQVKLEVYDMKGNLVDQVYAGIAQGGKTYQFEWQAGSLPSGMYISRLVTRHEVLHQKIVYRP
jgi:hypothetical protein